MRKRVAIERWQLVALILIAVLGMRLSYVRGLLAPRELPAASAAPVNPPAPHPLPALGMMQPLEDRLATAGIVFYENHPLRTQERHRIAIKLNGPLPFHLRCDLLPDGCTIQRVRLIGLKGDKASSHLAHDVSVALAEVLLPDPAGRRLRDSVYRFAIREEGVNEPTRFGPWNATIEDLPSGLRTVTLTRSE